MCEVVEDLEMPNKVQLSRSSRSVEWSRTPTELAQGRGGGTEELKNSYQRSPKDPQEETQDSSEKNGSISQSPSLVKKPL